MAVYIENTFKIMKSKADTTTVVVGADSNNTAGTVIGGLGILENLASTAYKSSIPGATISAASLANNINEAKKDIDRIQKIDDSTMMALASDTLALLGIIAVIGLTPELAALAAVAATAAGLMGAFQTDSTDVSDTWSNIFDQVSDFIDKYNLDKPLNDLFNWLDNPENDIVDYPSSPDLTYDPNKLTPITPDSDIDHDGIPDWLDPDMDGDGIPDAEDSDRDGDGIPDEIDPDPLTPEPNPEDGHPFPYDPLKPKPQDPLVLDMNQDGLISTVSLENSQVYFDITGDGVKEKVGWILPEDGLLVYDKNGNGKIDGVNEIFGKEGISGFVELRTVADSNYDGIIDRRDALYSQLKVWQDLNQDGISQSNELKSLSEAGVTKIELDVFATNINLNGNLLTEAGRYGDSTGTRSLAADIQLMTLEKISSNPSAIETYEIDPITYNLPQMRGYGYIDNSFKAYNLDPKLKELALVFMEDKEYASANFGEFLLRWSGFYDMAASQGVNDTQLSPYLADHSPIKLWMMERFAGVKVDGWRTEAHLRENTNGGYHNQSFANETYVTDQFNLLLQRYEAMFAIQAYYGDVFGDVHYDISIDEFVIDDPASFTTKLTEYLNDDTISQSDKLYLASMMNNLEGTFLHFDTSSMIDSISDTTLKATVSDIMDDKIHFQFAKDSGIYSYDNTLVYGNDSAETIGLNSNRVLTVNALGGDDLIRDNAGGNTTYIYRKGDGADTIYDVGGNDTLQLEDITLDDVDIEVKNTDLYITLKSDPNDQIRIVDWKKVANRIETIQFAGESQIDLNELLFPKTEGDDYIELTNGDDTVDTLGGNDTVYAFAGNDTIIAGGGNDIIYAGDGNDTLSGDEGSDKLYGENGNDVLTGGMGDDLLDGGAGNDTYVYNLGDAHDTITDGSGTDTLRFGEGISADMLVVHTLSNGDRLIGLKEEGKTLAELGDTITIRGWSNAANRIETVMLSDGSVLNLDALQVATEDADTLTFGDGGITLDALGGDDTITSGSGNDTIRGGAGNDTLNAGNGDNILYGNEGDDLLNTGSGSDTLYGGSGNDTLSSGGGADTLYGEEGADTLIAGDGNDILSGGAGSDVMQGGLGDDLYLYNRGDGQDVIIDEYRYGYNGANQSNAGNDTLRFGEGITQDDLIAIIRPGSDDLILALKEEGKTFEELSDVITIKNWVNINSRIETISLSDGTIVDLAAIQSATEGNDNLIYGDSAVTIDALAGDDTVITGSANDTLYGGGGSDSLRSGTGDDTLYGDEGNDTLYAGSGNDLLSGGEGDDILYGENGNDTLSGNAGNDTLAGGLGNDTYLFGLGDGHDVIIDEYAYGSGGNDTLRFGEGITVDNLVARAVNGSNDLVIGIREDGKGFDALSDVVTLRNWFDANKRIENFVLFDGTAITLAQMQGGTDGDDYLVFGDTDTVMDALGGNDTIITGQGNDTLYGNAGNDILISNAGNDTLSGGEGNDILRAGEGNDVLIGGAGSDLLEGGTGNDTYYFSRGDGKDSITDSAGLDSLIFGEGISADDLIARVINGSDDLQIAINEEGKTFDQLSDVITISGWRNAAYRIENLHLSDGSAIALTQIERSSEGDDYLVFADEGVSVDALGGNDTLIAGDGNDTLSGGAGNDTILGGKGNDTLSGGTGSDTLKGGTGNDTYLYNRGDGIDTIFDELGSDILSFGEGITKDDLIFKQQGNNLLIGLGEVNKTFDQLSDVMTIKDWFLFDSNIESIHFSDGSGMIQSEIAAMFVFNDIQGALFSKPGAIMYGGSGNNTYVYNRGDFTVVIDDQYQQGQIDVNAGTDTLYLNGGINKNDVTFGTVGNDLILKITPKVETYEQLRDYVVIKNWTDANKGIEKIVFSNGEVMEVDKTASISATTFNYSWVTSQYFIYGDDTNTVVGSIADETFETNGGNDSINAGSGNDRIYAGDGDDIIEGGAGNDVIAMGAGNDSVSDSSGDDIYLFNKGDGKDTIDDLSGKDTIVLGEGITKDDLIIKQSGRDLLIGIVDGDNSFEELRDILTIKNWSEFLSHIEKFQFSDATELTMTDVYSLLSVGYDETIIWVTENFESGAVGWSDNTTESASELTQFLGRFGGTGGNEGVSKTYDFGIANANKQIIIEFDMYEIDSWDGELFRIFINNNIFISNQLWVDGYAPYVANGDRDLGSKTSTEQFTDWGGEDIHHYNLLAQLDEFGKVKLGFGSTLNESLINESWGIDNISIKTLPEYVLLETFEEGASGWNINTTELSSELSRFLGRFGGTGGNEGISKVYDFGSANAGKQITIEFDMYEIDSWDGEQFKIFLNGVNTVTNNFYVDDYYTWIYDGGSKTSVNLFSGWGSEDIHHFTITTTLDENGQVKLGFGTTLDEATTSNESWGVDNITIYMDPSSYSPPLILDLNSNGMTSISLSESNTYFDYGADGLKEHTAWIEKGDALLVRDINNDGIINDGSELFGDHTKLADGSLASDGYAALAGYDTNNDGVIDKNDTDFAQLKLWQDTNLNGKTDAGELVDLSVAGITSLSLNRADGSVYAQSTENGNIITNETSYASLSDTGTMRDVWFKIDETDTITDNDTIYGTEEDETLSGDVGNDTYVIAYGGGADVIDDNGNGADTIRFISGITADRLIVQWVRGTDDLRIGIKINAEDDTPITELSNTILIKNWFNDTGAIERFDFSDGTTLDRQGIYNLLLNVEGDLTMRVLDAGETLSGNSGNDVLYGLDGSETLYGKDGSDYLSALAGDDYLSAGAGDDTLEGGIGDDTLEGGIGDDYYLFDKGDGKDVIIDAGGVDTLYFGANIDRRDVIVNIDGEDLVVTFSYNEGQNSDTVDQITIKNWDVDDFKIESFAFNDGTSYSLAELIEKNTNHAPEMFFEEGERDLGKERSAKGILLADDIDGDTLTYVILSAPTMGTISINQYGIWTYTGTSRDAGTDTVTIAIRDGRGGEITTRLSFVMEALNQAPEAPAELSYALQDIRIFSGEVGASDIDGDTLTYTLSTAAEHGTLNIDVNGSWKYAANEGYMGTDSAVITIDDGNGGVITQTLNFTMSDTLASAPVLEMAVQEVETITHSVVIPGNGWKGIETLQEDIGTVSTLSTAVSTNPSGLNAGDNALELMGDISVTTLKAYDGNDILDIFQRPNDIDMGAGNDVLRLRFEAGGKIWLGTGADVLEIATNSQAVSAGDGADRIKIGHNAAGTIELGAGNDDLDIGGDADAIYGGIGDDRIRIGNNAIRDIQLNDGNDTLFIGGINYQTIDAGIGNDTVVLGSLIGSVYLRDGNDTLVIQNDYVGGTVEAGAGNDTLWLQNVTKSEWLENTGDIRTRLTGFENIKFSDGSFIGNEEAFETITSMFDTTLTTTEYRYTLTLNAGLSDTDGSETLSGITLFGLPSDIGTLSVADQTLDLTDGSVLIDTTSPDPINVSFVSQTLLSDTVLGQIGASVTSTESSSQNSSTVTVQYTTPIILDMNGDGIHTLSLDEGITFDLNADGIQENVGWSDGIDAFLVRDLNQDGMISDGSELFGNNTILSNGTKAQDGYAAMADLDENYDSVLDNRDTVFRELSVWIDTNLNGKSDVGEILNLDEAGITSFDLQAYADTSIDQGNRIGLKSSYTTIDKESYESADVWFATRSVAEGASELESSSIDFDVIIQQICAFKQDNDIQIANNDRYPIDQNIMNIVANSMY